MGVLSIISWLSSIWPFSPSDLSTSEKLLRSVPLHPSTKRFLLALPHPDHPSSVVYILSSLALSERSASDARLVIRTLNPRAVIAQVGPEALHSIGLEEHSHATDSTILPTSTITVIKESFLGNDHCSNYQGLAGTKVTSVIFGTSFHGHVVAAKEAAKELDSAFYYLESQLKQLEGEKPAQNSKQGEGNSIASQSLALSPGSTLPAVSSAHKRFSLPSDLKSALPYTASSLQHSLRLSFSAAGISEDSIDVSNVDNGFECPTFALSFYPLLTDLHSVWEDLPGLSIALESVHKLLINVERGRTIDHSEVALSQNFRLAVEGLRVALNDAARSPLKRERTAANTVEFNDLPYEDKCYVLLAQALKQQARKSKTVVAVLDADIVAGVRKHWNTPVPEYISSLAEECLVGEDIKGAEQHGHVTSDNNGKLLHKPVVVVGAGAAAAVGLASFSHLGPVSTAMKILSFKVPMAVKFFLLQTKRSAVVAAAKVMSPLTKVFVPVKSIIPTKFAKASAIKAASSTGKIRAAAHSVVAYAERASLSAIRTTFYHVMWNRKHKSLGARPWVMFAGSVSTCALLLTFGDGIENAIESVPEAPAIAQLGRGLKNLSSASETLKQAETNQRWENMYHDLYRQAYYRK